MNNISTMKLARVTNDALDNLEQDPQAVERAIDAYQGRIPVDRSQSTNLKRQAESLQNLFDAITTEVPKAIGTLSDVGEQEAFDEWQQASPKEQETWRAAVKNNEVGPWHSPFFNRGMEKMVANDHVLKYATQYQTTYATARTSGDKKFLDDQGQFDLAKFNQTNLKTYQEENGLLNMSGQAYAIFARGTGPVHAEATAKNAEAKAAVIMGNHVDLFGKQALVFAKTLPAIEAGAAISKKVEEVIHMGIDPKKYHAQVEAVFTNTYIEHIKAGLDGDKYLETWGEILTGSGSQKLKDLPKYATKVALIRARGDAAAKSRDDMLEHKKLQVVKKYRDDFQSVRENPTNRLLTDKQFINQEANEGYLETAKLWHNSTDPLKKQFSARILGMRGGALTNEAFKQLLPQILNDMTHEEAERFLADNTATSAHYIEYNKAYDLNQDAQLGVSGVEYKTTRDGWLAKGYEDSLGANRPGEIPRNRLDIKRGLRANWDAELSTVRRQTLAAGILRINGNKDLSEPERQEKLEELVTKANTDYEDGMQAKLAEVVAEKTAIRDERQEAAAKEKVRAAHIKNMDEGKWRRGDRHLEDQQRLLKVAATAVKDSQFQKDALISADKALMRSYRFKQAAESLGIEPTLENISAVADQMRLITSDIYGPKGVPKKEITPEQKKEIQETALQGLQGWFTNTKDSLLNIAPEFVQKGVDAGLDGIQRGVESFPETASGLVDTLKDTLGDVGLPGFEEGAGEVMSAVTDAVLGKEAVASAKVVAPTKGVMQPSTESNTSVSQLRNVRNNNPGNIKLNSANKWRGQNNTGTEGDTFSHFDTPEQGTRALVKVIGANLKATNSYETYVNRYASEPKEKAYYKKHGKLMPHLEQYAKSLMKSQGATDIKSKPSNVDMTEWVKATITAEGGAEALTYFSDTVINKGVELAGVAPPSNTHTVKKGDSLYRIAKALGTTVAKLQAANNIKNANSIAIGQKIKRG